MQTEKYLKAKIKTSKKPLFFGKTRFAESQKFQNADSIKLEYFIERVATPKLVTAYVFALVK